MRKKTLLLMMVLGSVSLANLTACTRDVEYVEPDVSTDMLRLDGSTLTQEFNVPNENFQLIVNYDSPDYNLQDWHVTDSKSISMTAYTKNLPDGYEVYIDHVHADISLKATSTKLNGLIQDSMDDTSHLINQNGFYINNDIKYNNIFGINGYSETFVSLYGSSVSINSELDRLSETNILKLGTYAEKLQVVYDLSIKRADETQFHTVSIVSTLLIPVSQDSGVTIKKEKIDLF